MYEKPRMAGGALDKEREREKGTRGLLQIAGRLLPEPTNRPIVGPASMATLVFLIATSGTEAIAIASFMWRTTESLSW